MRSAILLAWMVVSTLVEFSRADDFRVESTVFANKQKEPVSHSTTVFHAGVIYDYLEDPQRTAVLDPAHGRFILLDNTRHEKAELKLDDITTAVSELRTMAENSSNGFLKFVARPDFEIHVTDDAAEEISFVAPAMAYRLKCVKAPSAEVARQYREFLDWTARLNAIMAPASPPPFARLAVNEEVAKRQLTPESVELTIPKQLALGGRGLTLRSEHVLTWRLLQKDQDQIGKTSTQMASYKLIPFAEYRANQPK